MAYPIQRLSTGWTVRESNPSESDIFRTRPDRPWGPPSVLYNANRVLLGSRPASRLTLNTLPSSVEVKERVRLYIYSWGGVVVTVLRY